MCCFNQLHVTLDLKVKTKKVELHFLIFLDLKVKTKKVELYFLIQNRNLGYRPGTET
jgi:hypothetical protein